MQEIAERMDNLKKVDALFDFQSPEFLNNPYPIYAKIREQTPFYLTANGFYVATRYNDVDFLLRDKRFGKDYWKVIERIYGADMRGELAFQSISDWMVSKNPPDHTRLRGLVSKAFNPTRVENMRPRIKEIAMELIDRVIDKGKMDAIKDYAFLLPVTVICEILGIPEEDRVEFLETMRISTRMIDLGKLNQEQLSLANQSVRQIYDYLEKFCALRRAQPKDDLTTALIQAEDAENKISTTELIANIFLLFYGGHETVLNLIGNGLLALQQHPEQWQMLKNDLSLVPNAIEELLRYDAPIQLIGRVALEDVVVNDQSFKQGDYIITALGAANRDPAVFPDPDRLDVTRTPNRHLGFASGIHFCAAALLARIEGSVAFETLLQRIPDLKMDLLNQPEWHKTSMIRGLVKLPVSW